MYDLCILFPLVSMVGREGKPRGPWCGSRRSNPFTGLSHPLVETPGEAATKTRVNVDDLE